MKMYEYIKNNMNGFSGRFAMAVTDFGEKEPGALLITVNPQDRDGDTADFILYPDGREEYTELI